MKDIKYDMFGKVKSVKDLATAALGKVEVKSKVLADPEKPEKVNEPTETCVCEEENKGAEVKTLLLKKLVAKKVEAPEVKTNEPNIVTEAKAEETKDEVKTKIAKTLVKAKKTDAEETPTKE